VSNLYLCEKITCTLLQKTRIDLHDDGSAPKASNGSLPECSPVPLSQALISIGRLRRNVRAVQRLVGTARIMAVVKANGYGHSVDGIAKPLVEEGVRDFGVANIHEAIHLRKVLHECGIHQPVSILAFASALPEHLHFYLQHDIELSISDFEVFQCAEQLAANFGKPLTVHLKIDTGMGRLGVQPAQALELAEAIYRSPHLLLKAIYTHFACSGTDRAFTQAQLALYLNLVREFEHRTGTKVIRHVANSGAILTDAATYLDMVRPGILLYGYAPSTAFEHRLPLEPVMQLQSHVVLTKWVEAGATISYGRQWRAPRRTRIATVAIGYADGYPRLLSNKAQVLIGGKCFPQVGAITMDALMVDLGEDTSVQVGDSVTLFGWETGFSVNELAESIGTIGYELLCAVSPRVQRIFVE
jgi:alanine racemase